MGLKERGQIPVLCPPGRGRLGAAVFRRLSPSLPASFVSLPLSVISTSFCFLLRKPEHGCYTEVQAMGSDRHKLGLA